MKISENKTLSRYEWAAEQLDLLLPNSPANLVADIGTGDARMRAVVSNAGARWIGYDLRPSAEGVLPWDIEQEADPQSPRAAIVLALDVLEHLSNPWRAMRNIANLMLPEGYLLLTTPNPLWSRSRIWALAKGTPACFTQSDLDLNHHVFTPWPHIVERLLVDCGLTVTRYDTLDGFTQWPSGPFTLRYPIRLAVACLTKSIEMRDPSSCGMSYAVVARKHAA